MAKTDSIKKALTALSVKRLKSGYLSDILPHSGLRIVVNKSGSKTWVYRYRSPLNNKLKQVKLGLYPTMELAAARAELIRLKGERDSGIDPQQRKKEQKAERVAESHAKSRNVFTVSDMVDAYLDNHIANNRKPKGQAEVRRILENNVKPVLGGLRPDDVKRSMVKALRDSIEGRGAVVLAGQVVRELRAAFEYAIDKQLIENADDIINPCMGVKVKTSKRSKRTFTEQEISEWMRWLPVSKMSRSVCDALSLVMYTGCRSGEAVELEWCDIDLEAGTWFLAGDKTKTEVERTVQLSTQAVRLLKTRLNDTPFVFPSPRNIKKHISQKVIVHAVCTKRDKSGLKSWSAHDIRRTVRTGLSRMRCPSEVGEAVLGHSKKGMTGVYDLHKHEPECREWLQKWSDRVEALGAADNVVSLGVVNG